MRRLAKVSLDRAVVFLPVETPYDRDLLFEYLSGMTTATEPVRVELDGMRLLTGGDTAAQDRCGRCERCMPPGARRYLIDQRTLCTRCARATTSSSLDASPPPAT